MFCLCFLWLRTLKLPVLLFSAAMQQKIFVCLSLAPSPRQSQPIHIGLIFLDRWMNIYGMISPLNYHVQK